MPGFDAPAVVCRNGFPELLPAVLLQLPLVAHGLGWVVPMALILLVAALADWMREGSQVESC